MVSILYGYLCPSFPCNLNCSIALICSLFQGTFNDLDHHQVASLASCFVPCDKSSEQIRLRNELSRPMMQLQEAARKIAEVYFYFDISLTLLRCKFLILVSGPARAMYSLSNLYFVISLYLIDISEFSMSF